MFKFKLVIRQKCLDNMKINGFSCSPKLGDSAEERYRSVNRVGNPETHINLFGLTGQFSNVLHKNICCGYS